MGEILYRVGCVALNNYVNVRGNGDQRFFVEKNNSPAHDADAVFIGNGAGCTPDAQLIALALKLVFAVEDERPVEIGGPATGVGYEKAAAIRTVAATANCGILRLVTASLEIPFSRKVHDHIGRVAAAAAERADIPARHYAIISAVIILLTGKSQRSNSQQQNQQAFHIGVFIQYPFK